MANFLSRFFKSRKDVPESVDELLKMAKNRLSLVNFPKDLLVGPKDVLSRPDFALSILVGKAFEMRKDPFEYVVDILKVLDIVFTPKWRLMVKVAIVQYRMGLFINVLKDMQDADLEMPVRNTGVTYATCIERTTEELEDELKQINGLLDEAKVMAANTIETMMEDPALEFMTTEKERLNHLRPDLPSESALKLIKVMARKRPSSIDVPNPPPTTLLELEAKIKASARVITDNAIELARLQVELKTALEGCQAHEEAKECTSIGEEVQSSDRDSGSDA